MVVKAGYEKEYTQQSVQLKLQEFEKFQKLVKLQFDSGKPVDEIVKEQSKYFGLDVPLAWAMILKDKTDIEKFNLFGDSELGSHQPKLTDYWNFVKGDNRIGDTEYPGRLFAQNVMNILYRYSKLGDLVVDPMAGGGTVAETCLVMGRKCRSYDVNPDTLNKRKYITKWDITQGFHENAKNCDLIIFDPPYYKKKEKEYDYPSITDDRETFIKFIRKFAEDALKVLKKDRYLAMVCSQYIDYDDELQSVLIYDLVKEFEEAGFRTVINVQCPLSLNAQYQASTVENAKKQTPWKILPISRDWTIFKKII